MRLCACGRPLGTDRRRHHCTYCAAADPHRHAARTAKRMPQMFVSVDSETRWDAEAGRQVITTLSFGREDGTSETVYNPTACEDFDAPEMYRWLIERLSKPYTDSAGQSFEQVAVAFHFGHDTAVLANNLDYDSMFLVRKVQSKIRTGLCGTDHDDERPCDVRPGERGILHRYRTSDVLAVLTDGMHSDLVAYHPSGLAMAFAPGQGAYLENRPCADRFEGWQRLRIRDTGRAFHGGLETVIAHWNPELSDAEREAIAWGKRARENGFEGARGSQIAAYSEAECVAHARVCRKLLDCIATAAHVPMRPDQLGGSGTIAAAVMRHYGVAKRTQTHSDPDLDQLALLTYFGGCIEAPVIGLISGLVDEEDINSAYPAQMVHLPCMRAGHGSWRIDRSGAVPGVEVGHALVSWSIPREDTSTPPFIVRRKDGRVAQPCAGSRIWVTLAELQTAIARFGDAIFVHRVVSWEPECSCEHPFEFLADLYAARNAAKAEMELPTIHPDWRAELDDIQRTIKLVINSIYGKLAQMRPEPGPFTNLHYASYITGATRAQMRRKAWEREDEGATVVYQHTDSVLSTGGTVADAADGLGEWGVEKPSIDFLVIQPGLAMSLGSAHPGKTASRGARIRDFTLAAWNWYQITDFTRHPREWPKLVTTQQVMITLRLAVARGKPHLAGAFAPKTTKVGIVSRKRDFDAATQLPGIPTAWAIPPPLEVDDPIREVAEMQVYRSALDRARQAGEYDLARRNHSHDQ